MKLVLYCIVLLYTREIDSQDLETNNKCYYSLGKSVFTCDGLTHIKDNIGNFLAVETHAVFIKNSNVTLNLNSHNNSNYGQITSYNILDNNQLKLQKFAFKGLANLNYLKISGNYLPELKKSVFVGVEKVELLILTQNNLSNIELETFKTLSNLITLDISENELTVISSKIFNGLHSLNTLLLSQNKIQIIEDNGFSTLPNLEILDLNHNNIDKLNKEQFNSLVSLKYLYLSFNKIEKLSFRIELPKLTFVTFNNNNINEIANDAFWSMENVISINLSYNSVKNISENHFQNVNKLHHLNLKNNKLNSGSFSDLFKSKVLIIF